MKRAHAQLFLENRRAAGLARDKPIEAGRQGGGL